MRDFQTSMGHLGRALRHLPGDRDLQPVRQYMLAAMKKLNEVAHARNQQQAQALENQRQEFTQKLPYMNDSQARWAITQLDSMIQEQMKLLAELNKPKTKPSILPPPEGGLVVD